MEFSFMEEAIRWFYKHFVFRFNNFYRGLYISHKEIDERYKFSFKLKSEVERYQNKKL